MDTDLFELDMMDFDVILGMDFKLVMSQLIVELD